MARRMRIPIELVLESNIRRRRAFHAAITIGAAGLAIISTMAVRFEVAGGEMVGLVGVVVSALEFVFITGIIPLLVTVIYYGASTISLHYLLKRKLAIPEARLRKLV